MKKKITVQAIQNAVGAPQYEFPKYTTQVINLVNSNAGGTRPRVVGQMSELIQEFPGQTLNEWVAWYNEQQPEAMIKQQSVYMICCLRCKKRLRWLISQ